MSTKSQPWKVHWPPATTAAAGETHGFPVGSILRLEGSAGAHPPPAEEKAQPSKASWPPQGVATDGHAHDLAK
jgi:hypothetical protein